MKTQYLPVPVKLLDYMELVNRYMSGEVQELEKEWLAECPEQYRPLLKMEDDLLEEEGGDGDVGDVIPMKSFRHDQERNRLLKQARETVEKERQLQLNLETENKEEDMAKRTTDSLGTINAKIDALIGDENQVQVVLPAAEIMDKAGITKELFERSYKDFVTCNHHSIDIVVDTQGNEFLRLVRHVKYWQRWFVGKPVPAEATEKGRGGKTVTMPTPPAGYTVKAV